MPNIQITLSEEDVHNACRDWAVTRILNEGKAVSSEIHVTVCNGKPNGALTVVTVDVETDQMRKFPKYIPPAHTQEEDF